MGRTMCWSKSFRQSFLVFLFERDFPVAIKWDQIGGVSNAWKCVLILRDFCCNSASFRLVSYNDPCFPNSLAAKLNGLSLPGKAAVSPDVCFYVVQMR